MKSTNLEGLFYWGTWQSERRIDFNGFYWSRPGGGLLIDPMELTEDRLAFCRQAGGASWILVTNADHLRAAVELKEQLGCHLLAPLHDRERFGDAAAAVDTWFARSEDLPAELAGDVEIHPIRGGKSPVEIALYLPPLQALVFGDVVRSHESGRLRLLPDEKLSDRDAVVGDLVPLAELAVDAVLLGDGDPLLLEGGRHFRRFVASLR